MTPERRLKKKKKDLRVMRTAMILSYFMKKEMPGPGSNKAELLCGHLSSLEMLPSRRATIH